MTANALAIPSAPELVAPAEWRTIDFIADLHLQDSDEATVQAWRHYLATTPADAVFMLGDLFEVWIGDDAAHEAGSFEQRCGQILLEASRQRDLLFMAGNRDFLLGDDFLRNSGLRGLTDPTVLVFGGERFLLSHGDALCLDDQRYMQFRAMVRSPQWQQELLAKPLAERKAIARHMREQSKAHNRRVESFADLDADATRAWLQAAGSAVMIHGHTHQPADHDLGHGLQRIVLSDWDAGAQPPRLEALRLTLLDKSEVARQRIPLTLHVA
ncbi:MAG: UDP-2,3-diacylglucosamine hydrolase [Paracidovorax wautersii]|uniref:UDP-2,3-diacylglucosamine hydrolase n=1 Tax=Paracidovorax wautersii TaxID=1177982 RepID=A0A7V8JNW5_9BURK|nr:MAG: UDP-2,3-diacylglucosamine hydrolase [Paracidovorax wautersii]